MHKENIFDLFNAQHANEEPQPQTTVVTPNDITPDIVKRDPVAITTTNNPAPIITETVNDETVTTTETTDATNNESEVNTNV